MLRRIVILTTLLALVLAAVPASAASLSREEAMRSAIQSQFDAYARELNYTDVHEDAIKQLLKHAMTANGSALTVGSKDPLVGSMFNSVLFRQGTVSFILATIQQMQRHRDNRAMLDGSFSWYEHKLAYDASLCAYNTTADTSDDTCIGFNTVRTEPLESSINAHDKAMMLVVGGVICQVRATRARVTDAEITYSVKLSVFDDFDFNGKYADAASKGYDASTAKLISAVGKLLDLGLIDSFSWNFDTELQFTVPNYCDHSSGDYRWELQGSNLASVTDGGFTVNALSRIDEQLQETDKYPRYYYQLHHPVHLMHDRPWVVEWSMANCSRNFLLSPNKAIGDSELPYLVKTGKYIAAAWYNCQLEGFDERAPKHIREQYGVNYYDLGFTNKGTRVYRLENRIAADGSNMIWLLIDGVELGPLNGYMPYHSTTGEVEQTGKAVNWANGKDFLINYIGNKTFPIRDPQDILYLQIWEDFASDENQNYLNSQVQAPTCTEQGYTSHTCKICGAVRKDNAVAAIGHSWDAGVVTREATFREPGEITFTCGNCQATRVESFEKPRIDLEGTTMTLGDSLSVNFILDTDALDADGAYAVITKTYADGRESAVAKIPWEAWKQYSGNLYYFSFDGVAAKEMCDTISVQVYASNGNKISNPYTDSIRDYAMRMLGKPEVIADEALRSLYVDMLNYGAEAQLHFGYDTRNPANGLLTPEQRAWASAPCETESRLTASPGRTGTTLTLKNRITLDFIFSNRVLGTDYSKLYATAVYTDHYGKPVTTRIEDIRVYDADQGYVAVPGLAAADYGTLVTCTVYNKDGNAVAWAADSIQGYAHRMAGTLPSMVEAILRFSNSAYRYFHK